MEKKEQNSRREMIKLTGVAALAAGATSVLASKTAVAAITGKEPRWAMVIDMRKCIGCRGCTVACKAEFDVPLGAWNAVVREVASGKYPDVRNDFLPKLCNHCAGNEKDKIPPCVDACPQHPIGEKVFLSPNGEKIKYKYGATYKRPDGLVLLDNSLCIGCGACIDSCPYGARAWNKKIRAGQDKKEFGITKCTFCQHRIDEGTVPSCVNTCTGRARIFGDLNDPKSEVSKLAKEFNLLGKRNKTTLLPKEGTTPFVLYIDPKGALTTYTINEDNKEQEFRDQIV